MINFELCQTIPINLIIKPKKEGKKTRRTGTLSYRTFRAYSDLREDLNKPLQ